MHTYNMHYLILLVCEIYKISVSTYLQFLGDPLVAVQQVIAKVRLNCTTHPKYCATRKISEAVSAATTQLLSNIRTVDK